MAELSRLSDAQADPALRASRIRLFESSGVDKRHMMRKATELVGCPPWTEALAKARAVVARGGMAVLLGDRGTGKTQLAVELVRDACREIHSARYFRSREVGMFLREAYGDRASMTELQAINGLVSPWLLVIDECQERPDKDWEIRSLTLVLDKRYGSMKPTILIANCTPKQFQDLMGPSVVDRIREDGGVIACNWKGFRGGGD